MVFCDYALDYPVCFLAFGTAGTQHENLFGFPSGSSSAAGRRSLGITSARGLRFVFIFDDDIVATRAFGL